MDPVTMILTALSAGAGVAGETIFKESVKRAYDNLLKGVKKHFEKDKNAKNALDSFLNSPAAFEGAVKYYIEQLQLAQDRNLQELADQIVLAVSGDPKHAMKSYCDFLISDSQYISLQGVDVDSSDPNALKKRMELLRVYVDLNTTAQRTKKFEKILIVSISFNIVSKIII